MFDSTIDRFDDHNDSICFIEEKQKEVCEKFNHIDETLKNIDKEIKRIEERESIEENKIIAIDAAKDVIKKCKFYNSGFCKAKSECIFYHAEKECDFYIKNGFCNIVECRQRHPK